MPQLSIVIPCLNEEKYLPELLKNIKNQTIRPTEVIVADSASQDGTLRVAEKFKRDLPIKITKTNIKTAAAARNAGAKVATGKYLLFIDADIRMPDNAVAKLHDLLEEKPVDVVTPRYKSDGGHPVDTLLFKVVNFDSVFHNILLGRPFVIGGFLCVKKDVHKKIGGFNEHMAAFDDTDYGKKLNRQKISFYYLRSLTVIHSSRRYHDQSLPSALWALIKENSHIGKAVIQPYLRKKGRGKKYGQHL